jgi:glycerol-3-phosphate dehydrogenase
VDRAARQLRRLDGRSVPRHAGTDREPLPGGEIADLGILVRDLVEEGLDREVAESLAGRYGSEAAAVANIMRREPALAVPLVPGQTVLAAEVAYQARREMALTVEDVLTRRTHLFHVHAGQAVECAALVARLLGAECGWDGAEQARQVQAYRDLAARMRQAVTPEPPA